MKAFKNTVACVFALAIFAAAFSGCGAGTSDPDSANEATKSEADAKNEDGVFVRIDRDDPDAWQNELSNLRFLTDGEYSFKTLHEDLVPSEEGFDTLNISGSAQFSVNQFKELAPKLREYNKRVYIIDTRLESHGFINDIAYSWCGKKNAANLGKTREEIEGDEKGLSSVIGSTLTAYTAVDDEPDQAVEIEAKSWQTERELVEGEGFYYHRLACPDHCWPPAEVIDEFIEFANGIDMNNSWLHFHCQAGKGRTGAFMTIYDMMKNPGVACDDILLRQAMTGSGNLYDKSSEDSSFSQKERCVLARAVYAYIQENCKKDYIEKWSTWLEHNTQELTLKVGESKSTEGDAFSSDVAVVDDSFTATGVGEACVFADNTVYYVTVE